MELLNVEPSDCGVEGEVVDLDVAAVDSLVGVPRVVDDAAVSVRDEDGGGGGGDA